MAPKNINDDPSFNPSCSWGLGVSTPAGPGGRSSGREQEGRRVGGGSTRFCTFLLVGERPSDQTAEFWEGWVETMRMWVLERGHPWVGRVEQDRMGSCREKGWLAPKLTKLFASGLNTIKRNSSSTPPPTVTTSLANSSPQLCRILGSPGDLQRLHCCVPSWMTRGRWTDSWSPHLCNNWGCIFPAL